MGCFSIQITDHCGIPVIEVLGEFDLQTAPQVRTAAKPFVERRQSGLIFDLNGTTFMDSSGVAILLAVKRDLSPGQVRVVANADPARRLLQRLALGGYLGIHADRGEAVEGLKSPC